MAVVTGTVIAAGAAAYSAHEQASAAGRAAKAAAAPKTTSQTETSSNTSTPGNAATQAATAGALTDAQNLYKTGLPKRGIPHGGMDAQTKGIENQIIKQGEAPNPNLAAANSLVGQILSPTSSTGSGQKSFSSMTINDVPAWAKASGVSGYQDYLRAHPEAPGNKLFGENAAPTSSSAARDALGYNPVQQEQYDALGHPTLTKSDSELDNFLKGTGLVPGSSGGGGGGGSAGGGYGGGGGGVWMNPAQQSAAAASDRAMVAGTGGQVTDQTGTGTFADAVKKVLAGGYGDPNDPNTAAYLDVISRRGNQDLASQVSAADGRADAIGMYGGSGARLQASNLQAKGLQGILDNQTVALQNFRQANQAGVLQAIGDVNQRDIAGSGMASSERIADSNRAAAGAGAAASLSAQLQLGTRAQNLQAIEDQMRNSQFGVSQLGDLGQSLTNEKNAAVGAIPGLDAEGFAGLGKALGASKEINAAANAAAAARANANYSNALLPQQNLDAYLRRLGLITGLTGGTSSSTSTGTGTSSGGAIPYTPSPNGAAIAAGLGAGLSTYGTLSG